MKIQATDSFGKSLQKFLNAEKFWRWEFWEDKWHSFKSSVQSLYKYFWITTKMVHWDYLSVLMMMRFQIGILSDHIEKNGYEVDEDRLPKVAKMKRFIELADHKIADDYADRCGYNCDHGFDFVPVEGKPGLSHMVSNAPPEVEKNNKKAIRQAHDLEEMEWNEMIEILKDLRSWWD